MFLHTASSRDEAIEVVLDFFFSFLSFFFFLSFFSFFVFFSLLVLVIQGQVLIIGVASDEFSGVRLPSLPSSGITSIEFSQTLRKRKLSELPLLSFRVELLLVSPSPLVVVREPLQPPKANFLLIFRTSPKAVCSLFTKSGASQFRLACTLWANSDFQVFN